MRFKLLSLVSIYLALVFSLSACNQSEGKSEVASDQTNSNSNTSDQAHTSNDVSKDQGLTDDEITNLSAENIPSVPCEKIKQMTEKQIQSFSQSQLQALTPEQIIALPPNLIKVLAMEGNKISLKDLTEGQTQALTQQQLEKLDELTLEEQHFAFSSNQMKLLAKDPKHKDTRWPKQIQRLFGHYFIDQEPLPREWLPTEIQNLDKQGIQILSDSDLRELFVFADKLTEEQIAAIQPDKIKFFWSFFALEKKQIQAFTPDQIQQLSPEQLSLAVGQLGSFTDAQKNSFTEEQLREMEPEVVQSLCPLVTEDFVSKLNVDQIPNLSPLEVVALTTHFRAIHQDQARTLTLDQMKVFGSQVINRLTSDHLRLLSPGQIERVFQNLLDQTGIQKDDKTDAVADTSLIPLHFIDVLDIDSIKPIYSYPRIIKNLSDDQIGAIRSCAMGKNLFNHLGSNARGLTSEQIKNLSKKKLTEMLKNNEVCIISLSPSAIGALGGDKVTAIPFDAYGKFSAEQLTAFSDEFLKNLRNTHVNELCCETLRKLDKETKQRFKTKIKQRLLSTEQEKALSDESTD